MLKRNILVIIFLICISSTLNAGPPGDIDNNGIIDLSDTILSFQIMVNPPQAGASINLNNDINEDGRIGFPEIIYLVK